MARYEVRTNYNRKCFDTIEEAEDAYFELCNQYDYVALVKLEPGKEPDVRRTSW